MLFDSFEYLPGTTHPCGKGDQISTAEFLRRLSLGCDDKFAAEYVANLLAIVGPGKLRDLLLPNGPIVDTQDIEFGGGGPMFTQYFHDSFRLVLREPPV